MEEKLISILERCGKPVILQGSLGPEEGYPDFFFSFWNAGSADHGHYDNDYFGTEYEFDVNCYGTDPQEVERMMKKVVHDLKEEGFIISGKGYSVPSDEYTHVGKGIHATIVQYEGKDE